MGYQKYVKALWKKPKQNMPELMKERLIQWRREPVTVRLERPTRIDRARSLGYKAKQGFIVVRQRLLRGGRRRPQYGKRGRRPKHNRQTLILGINYQHVAEHRVAKKFPNCEVLNSYPLAKDGKHAWYEVILVDKAHPQIVNDKDIAWIGDKQHRNRVLRGKTSAGRKSRGLYKKGKGSEKTRPSLRANKRLLN